jgi:hypothetical protein
MKTNNLKPALAYLRRGCSIFPCNKEKKPIIKSWLEFQKKLPTKDQVMNWYTANPTANIALVTGSISGIMVVDTDSPKAWEALQEYLPDNLAAPVVITPTGNRQIYFKYRPGLHSKNRVMPDTDLKTEGGYVVAPPSSCDYTKGGKHIQGGHRWQEGSEVGALPEMPEMLFAALEKLQTYCGTGIASKPPMVCNIIDENIQTGFGGVEEDASVSKSERITPYQNVSKRIINFDEGGGGPQKLDSVLSSDSDHSWRI